MQEDFSTSIFMLQTRIHIKIARMILALYIKKI